MADAAGWTVIATFPTVFEADMAAELLKGAGIPAVTRAESTGIFGPGYVGGVTGGARVVVPTSLAATARELLEEGADDDTWTEDEA